MEELERIRQEVDCNYYEVSAIVEKIKSCPEEEYKLLESLRLRVKKLADETNEKAARAITLSAMIKAMQI